MRTIYTYYEPIETIEDQSRLLEICSMSWAKNGWELAILNQKIAEKHEFYNDYSNIIKQFPSVNPPFYDYHCYIRWLAMAQIGEEL